MELLSTGMLGILVGGLVWLIAFLIEAADELKTPLPRRRRTDDPPDPWH